MSQAGTVTWLAVRELWISFRLLVTLVSFVGAGALVALLPAPAPVSLERVTAALAGATVIAAALAAWSLADERIAGRAGWLVTRSVSRGTYLLGWFAAMAGVVLLGTAAAASLSWVAISAAALALDPLGFGVAMLAVASSACAAIGLGLATGSLARPWLATAISVIACAAVAATAILLPDVAGWTPGAGYVALSRLAGSESVVAPALRAAGSGLVAAAVLLTTARIAFERAEL